MSKKPEFEFVEPDPFTAKRTKDLIREKHFENAAIYKDLAEEFGRRVGYAVREGLPPEMAFEACREHFKVMGQAMIDLANEIQLERLKGGGNEAD